MIEFKVFDIFLADLEIDWPKSMWSTHGPKAFKHMFPIAQPRMNGIGLVPAIKTLFLGK